MRIRLRKIDLRWPLLATVGLLLLGQKNAEPTPQEIAEQLASQDDATVRGALQLARSRMDAEPTSAASLVRGYWLKPLVDRKNWAVAEEFAMRGMIAGAADLGTVEYLQRQRVLMLRQQNRADEALREARSLCSVCSMAGMESALLLFAECLNATDANDPNRIDHLIAEQIAGAATTAERPITSPTLLGIMPNPGSVTAWDAAIAAIRPPTGELPASVPDLLALGNLQLLAGRPEQARAAFAKVNTLAELEFIRTANEAQARLLKAEDGTVGRANAFAQSLKPAK